MTEDNLSQISYRSLKNGYQLAEVHPESWQELMDPLLPSKRKDPKKLVIELAATGIKVKDQASIFEAETGLKVRSFYNYRRDLKLFQNKARN